MKATLYNPKQMTSKYLSYNDADRSKSTINIYYPKRCQQAHQRHNRKVNQLNRDYFYIQIKQFYTLKLPNTTVMPRNRCFNKPSEKQIDAL